MTESTPLEPQEPPKLLFKVMNPLLKLILRSPLHSLASKQLMLLTFTGRKTGKQYTTPVGYAQPDARTILSGTKDRWYRNLQGGRPVRVWLRGQKREGTADVIADEEGMIEGYRAIYTSSPGYASASQRATAIRFGLDGQPNREDVPQAAARGHVIVRVQLD